MRFKYKVSIPPKLFEGSRTNKDLKRNCEFGVQILIKNFDLRNDLALTLVIFVVIETT